MKALRSAPRTKDKRIETRRNHNKRTKSSRKYIMNKAKARKKLGETIAPLDASFDECPTGSDLNPESKYGIL